VAHTAGISLRRSTPPQHIGGRVPFEPGQALDPAHQRRVQLACASRHSSTTAQGT
jgi:hypothetical protein